MENNRKLHFSKCCFLFAAVAAVAVTIDSKTTNKHRKIPCKHETFHIKSNPIE